VTPFYVSSEIYRNSSYGPKHPLAVPRVSVCTDLCRALGWLPDTVYRDAPMATDAELARFHHLGYIAALRQAERDQHVSQETRETYRIGAEGNPVYREVFRRPAISAGGVMLAARAKGERRKEATDVMRDAGGKDVEHAEGKWEGGQWVDFASPAEGEPWPAPKSDGHEANDKAVPHPHAKPVAEEAVALDSTGNEDPGSELEHFVDQQVARHN